MDDPIKVLVVDDTVTYRKVLSDAVASMPEARVVGAVSGGALALKKMRETEVDMVLLDVFMPEMNGIETLKLIRQEFPDVSVVMVSGATTRDADITIEALNLGALDFVAKPQTESLVESRERLTEALRGLVRVAAVRRLVRRRPGEAPVEAAPAAAPVEAPVRQTVPPSSVELVVVGVSTGGPNALAVVLPGLPADFGCPILIVQHMPPSFTRSLASHLSKSCRLGIREAVDGEPVKSGAVLIAPGGRHMVVRPAAEGRGLAVALTDTMPVNSCRPSVDVLFRSVAQTVDVGVLAVVLTGMGEDGAAGIAAMKRKRCYALAQDEKSCVVYGMPRSVVERGLADEVVPLTQMASRMQALAGRRG